MTRTAIVTGAARGIGAAVSRKLARTGWPWRCSTWTLRRASRSWSRSRPPVAGAGGRCQRRRRGRRRGRRRPWVAEARRTHGAGEQRRHHPRQPALQDDRGRLGLGDERPPAGCVPHEPGRADVHDRGEVGPDRQPVEHLGARQPRPGELLGGQGRHAGLHEDARHRARQVRRDGQRDRPRLHPDRHDEGHRRALGVAFEEFIEHSASQIPVARVGQPSDIANTVSFFASEGAGFVSGQVIYVAGGPKD